MKKYFLFLFVLLFQFGCSAQEYPTIRGTMNSSFRIGKNGLELRYNPLWLPEGYSDQDLFTVRRSKTNNFGNLAVRNLFVNFNDSTKFHFVLPVRDVFKDSLKTGDMFYYSAATKTLDMVKSIPGKFVMFDSATGIPRASAVSSQANNIAPGTYNWHQDSTRNVSVDYASISDMAYKLTYHGATYYPYNFAQSTDLSDHVNNSSVHVNSVEKAIIADAVTNGNISTILEDYVTLRKFDEDLGGHINNPIMHITDNERNDWNGKPTMLGLQGDYLQLKTTGGSVVHELDLSASYTPISHANDSGIHVTSEEKATIADAVTNTALTSALEGYVTLRKFNEDLGGHVGNPVVHITDNERNAWNGKGVLLSLQGDYLELKNSAGLTISEVDLSGNYVTSNSFSSHESNTNLHTNSYEKSIIADAVTNISLSSILESYVTLAKHNEDLGGHTGNSDIHVTLTDKTSWNSKANGSFVNDFYDSVWGQGGLGDRVSAVETGKASSTHTHTLTYETITYLDNEANSHTITVVTGIGGVQ